jgi:hypothetical protein
VTPARVQGIATQQPRARSFRLYRSLRHQSAKAVLAIYCSEPYCALLRDAYLLRPLVLRTEALNTSIQWHPLFRPPARPRPSYLQKSKRRSRTLYTSVVRLVQLFFDARCEATEWKLIQTGIAASVAGAVSFITCACIPMIALADSAGGNWGGGMKLTILGHTSPRSAPCYLHLAKEYAPQKLIL